MVSDRELDLIEAAETMQLNMSHELQFFDDSTAVLYGVLCATTAVARLLYNDRGDGTPEPPVHEVSGECPRCRAPGSNYEHRRLCRGPVLFDVNGAPLSR